MSARVSKAEALTVIREVLAKASAAAEDAFANALVEEFYFALSEIEAEAERRGMQEGFRRGLEARGRQGRQHPGDWRADARSLEPRERR